MAAHLTPLAAALLHEPPEQRIRAILSGRWVLYPRAKQALGVLNRLVTLPRTTRMPSITTHGDSGMGKTSPGASTSSRSGAGRRTPSSKRSSGPSCATFPCASRAR